MCTAWRLCQQFTYGTEGVQITTRLEEDIRSLQGSPRESELWRSDPWQGHRGVNYTIRTDVVGVNWRNGWVVICPVLSARASLNVLELHLPLSRSAFWQRMNGDLCWLGLSSMSRHHDRKVITRLDILSQHRTIIMRYSLR